MSAQTLPALFVGSSVEGLHVAHAVQELLEYDAEVTVWPQGIFRPTRTVLSDLLAALDQFTFSVFVFSPDDIVTMRGTSHRIIRDNVLFEFGMFVGRRGPDQSFYITPRDTLDFHLPTDLLGTTALTYQADRKDGNLLSAVAPACNKMRRAIETWRNASFDHSSEKSSHSVTAEQRFEAMVEAWNAPQMKSARQALREGINTDPYSRTAAETAALQTVFALLESISDKVLSGEFAEAPAQKEFRKAILAFWPNAAVALAPPNHVDEWWEPLPRIAQLYFKWKSE